MQTFFQNGDEQINGDGGPDLGAHGVGTGAIKRLPQRVGRGCSRREHCPA